MYAQSVHIFHNYMFRPILGHLQVVSYSLGYTKEPEDGLKWAETCSCGIYVLYVHKLCFDC